MQLCLGKRCLLINKLLYDFIADNHLSVANLNFSQKVNYTYSKGSTSSYIDHVLVTDNLNCDILDCKICSDIDICTSDHLPIITTLFIDNGQNNKNNLADLSALQYPKANWRNQNFIDSYRENINRCLSKRISELNHKDIASLPDDSRQAFVDAYCEQITSGVHDAVRSVENGSNGNNIKKDIIGGQKIAR
jgi:hypothetical protein